MGASGWIEIVEGERDVVRAFEMAQRQVFETRNYARPFSAEFLVKRFGSVPPPLQGRLRDGEPKTIVEARAWCADTGTHSILDMHRLVTEPTDDCIVELSASQIDEGFGASPTREAIERGAFDVTNLHRRRGLAASYFNGQTGDWQGWVFWGVSGD